MITNTTACNSPASRTTPTSASPKTSPCLPKKSLELLRSFISKSVTLATYLTILYELSGEQTLTLGGYEFTIHGYLIWIALAYSALTTWLGHLVGGKLQVLNVERQHFEADYRATLLRIRDHSEQIALYRGAPTEQARLTQCFAQIKSNWRALIDREYWFGMFYASYVRISIFIPIFATLPMYLAKKLSFGDIMQTRAAFARVQETASAGFSTSINSSSSGRRWWSASPASRKPSNNCPRPKHPKAAATRCARKT